MFVWVPLQQFNNNVFSLLNFACIKGGSTVKVNQFFDTIFCLSKLRQCVTGEPWFQCILILVENARKFRESAPNKIPIFGKPPPRVGVSENVWFFKLKPVDRANVRRKEQIYIRGDNQ